MKKVIFCILVIVFSATVVSAGTVSTSGITAQTVINQVRYDLNEPIALNWSDDELIQWMNEAITLINNSTRCLESGMTSIALVQDDYDYAISGVSFLDIEAVLHDSGNTSEYTQEQARIMALTRVRMKDLALMTETGRPKSFTLWNNEIIIYPVPNKTQSGTSIYLYLVTLPSGITTTTSDIETPAYFDPSIINYVKAKAFLKMNDLDKGNQFMGLFNLKLQEYMQTIIRRNGTLREESQ